MREHRPPVVVPEAGLEGRAERREVRRLAPVVPRHELNPGGLVPDRALPLPGDALKAFRVVHAVIAAQPAVVRRDAGHEEFARAQPLLGEQAVALGDLRGRARRAEMEKAVQVRMVAEHLIHLGLVRHFGGGFRIIERHVDDRAVALKFRPDEIGLRASAPEGREHRLAFVAELVGMAAETLHHVPRLFGGQSRGVVCRDQQLEPRAQFLRRLVDEQRALLVVRLAQGPAPAVQREAVDPRGLRGADLALVVPDARPAAVRRDADHVVRENKALRLTGKNIPSQRQHGQRDQ